MSEVAEFRQEPCRPHKYRHTNRPIPPRPRKRTLHIDVFDANGHQRSIRRDYTPTPITEEVLRETRERVLGVLDTGSRFPADATSWDIFDPEGDYLGQVELPARFRPEAVDGMTVTGVFADELDVEYVVRYRVVPVAARARPRARPRPDPQRLTAEPRPARA